MNGTCVILCVLWPDKPIFCDFRTPWMIFLFEISLHYSQLYRGPYDQTSQYSVNFHSSIDLLVRP
jgi:hypothetical protein